MFGFLKAAGHPLVTSSPAGRFPTCCVFSSDLSDKVTEILTKLGELSSNSAIAEYVTVLKLSFSTAVPNLMSIDLKVRYRFRDDSLAEDLDNLGVRIVGMPNVDDVTVGDVNNENMITALSTAFGYLARVAVFLEQARIGENLASNENVSFESHYRRLEDDHESGLYWLLCALHRIIYVSGNQINDDVMGEILRTKIVEVDRNALRHARDYLVLRDFERVLERISVDLRAMGYVHPPI